MIIYPASEGSLEADYYDSEGHRIHYVVDASSPGRAVFLSDNISGAPRFRLTYELASAGHLGGEFEIAPPGENASFSRYLRWDSVRSDSVTVGKNQ